jgi:acetyltransferase-like isoleucine patch superfamily enzyme
MNSFTRMWRTWRHGRKLTKKGHNFRFTGQALTIEGHVEVGDRCRFRENVTLRALGDGKIIFGSRTGCSWHCYMEARELIHIKPYAGVAEHVVLCDTEYQFMGNKDSWKRVPVRTAPIIVESNCFIGNGCYVGPGVTVGDGAVVAHHSVVLCDIPPLEIWGGVPARKMGHRTEGVPERVLEEFRRLAEEHGIQEDRHQL